MPHDPQTRERPPLLDHREKFVIYFDTAHHRTTRIRPCDGEQSHPVITQRQTIKHLWVVGGNEDLTRFNHAMVGREMRMIDLKKEVNELCAQAGQPPRYPLSFEK